MKTGRLTSSGLYVLFEYPIGSVIARQGLMDKVPMIDLTVLSSAVAVDRFFWFRL